MLVGLHIGEEMETSKVNSEFVNGTKKAPILISVIGNVFLVIIKGIVGVIADSHALIADAIHSLCDVIAFLISHYSCKNCRMLAKIGKREVVKRIDKKIVEQEIHSTYLISIVYLAFGSVTYIRNLIVFILGDTTPPGFIALVVAFIGFGVYVWVYKYFRKNTGENNKKYYLINKDFNIKQSYFLNKMNLFTGITVIIGLIGAKIGFPSMDSLAGVVVGAFMISIGIHCLQERSKHLKEGKNRDLRNPIAMMGNERL